MNVLKPKKCVIIGAGLAGVATAYHLTRMGLEEVVLLEQEAIPGMHASGRNAAMVRQVVADEAIARLARAGAAFLQNLPEDWPLETEFKQTGALLLTDRSGIAKWQAAAQSAREAGVPAEWWEEDRLRREVPVLADSPAAGAVWCPTDGVIDIHNLLHGFLRGAMARGAEIRCDQRVQNIVVREGKVCAVQTESDEIVTDIVVNAAGAWAGEIARLAGIVLPVTPYRRHLFIGEPRYRVEAGGPIVWDVTTDVYFRPDMGRLLLSPCDQTPHPAVSPGCDPAASELLAEKVSRCFPQLSEMAIHNAWACLRTMPPDHRFVVGWDAAVKGFMHVAGLGGHGVTVSHSIGLLAAQLIMRREEGTAGVEFDPIRFYSNRASGLPGAGLNQLSGSNRLGKN